MGAFSRFFIICLNVTREEEQFYLSKDLVEYTNVPILLKLAIGKKFKHHLKIITQLSKMNTKIDKREFFDYVESVNMLILLK